MTVEAGWPWLLYLRHGAAARQQRWRQPKMITDEWQALESKGMGGGRVNGHARNRENRRQQHSENRSARVATIGALNFGQLVV